MEAERERKEKDKGMQCRKKWKRVVGRHGRERKKRQRERERHEEIEKKAKSGRQNNRG